MFPEESISKQHGEWWCRRCRYYILKKKKKKECLTFNDISKMPFSFPLSTCSTFSRKETDMNQDRNYLHGNFHWSFCRKGQRDGHFFFNKTLKNSVYISRWLSPFLNFFLWNAFKKMESYQPKVASCLVTGCDTDEGALERSLRMIPVQAWDIFKTSWFSTSLRW